MGGSNAAKDLSFDVAHRSDDESHESPRRWESCFNMDFVSNNMIYILIRTYVWIVFELNSLG